MDPPSTTDLLIGDLHSNASSCSCIRSSFTAVRLQLSMETVTAVEDSTVPPGSPPSIPMHIAPVSLASVVLSQPRSLSMLAAKALAFSNAFADAIRFFPDAVTKPTARAGGGAAVVITEVEWTRVLSSTHSADTMAARRGACIPSKARPA